MPSFSPTIGTSVAPREPIWRRWARLYRKWLLVGAGILALLIMAAAGWWFWQGQYIPAPGGTVTEGIVGQPSHINPLFASANLVDAELSPLVFRGLLRTNDEQELVPDLASEWSRSEDGKTYSFTLGDYSWHDGQRITAEDVAFTIHLTQNQFYTGSWSKSFTNVEIDVLDSQHLRLALKEPFAPFAQNLTIGILPKHILGGKTIEQIEKDPFNVQPIGSGQLRFDSLELNPTSKQIQELRFKPVGGYLDAIAFRFYPTTEAMVTDFKLGKIQLLGGVYDPAFDDLASFPDKQEKSQLLHSQSYGLFFNLHQESVSDVGVRQALAYTTPRNQIITDVLNNRAVSLSGPYQPDFWAYSDRAETYNFDEGKAKELWSKVEKKPAQIRLLVPERAVYQQLAATVGQSWQKLGVDVSIITKSSADMGKVVNAHDSYDVVLLGEQSDIDPDRYSTWHSTQVPPNGKNITGESNKRVDKALEDGRKALSQKDRVHDYDLFQYYLAKDAPVIWLYQPKYTYIWSNKIRDVKLDYLWEPQDRFTTVAQWYVKTKRRD